MPTFMLSTIIEGILLILIGTSWVLAYIEIMALRERYEMQANIISKQQAVLDKCHRQIWIGGVDDFSE